MNATIAREGKPILVKRTSGEISHFHMPGESEYETVVEKIEGLRQQMKMSFDEAANSLGYELGYAAANFSV